MSIEVVKNPDRGRYEILVDGRVRGYAEYHEEGDRVVLPHTVIDPAGRGQGLASILVREVLADVAASGRAVVPTCWYVAGYLDRHPEVPVQVAPGSPGR